ncbi:MAG: discoidin domain-containing protein, partial [Planctomycetota bacterium]
MDSPVACWWRSRTFRLMVVFAVAWSCGLVAIGAAERPKDQGIDANIALGAKYTLSPQPNYPYCTDPGDTVQLTDGKSTTDYFWTQKGTVGWSGAPYAVVTVDLGRVEPISGVAMTTAAGVAGVLWPASIHILTSDDGKNYRDVGDLAALDQKRHGPWPKGYAIRRLATDELATRGRYVRFMIIPLSGCSYIFADEVEVFRGPSDLVQRDPGGKPVGDVAEIFQQGRISRALALRFAADGQALEKAIRESPQVNEATKKRLLADLAAAREGLKPSGARQDATFRAVLPMGDAHAKLFGVQAGLWRAAGAAPLTAA